MGGGMESGMSSGGMGDMGGGMKDFGGGTTGGDMGGGMSSKEMTGGGHGMSGMKDSDWSISSSSSLKTSVEETTEEIIIKQAGNLNDAFSSSYKYKVLQCWVFNIFPHLPPYIF